MALEIPPFLPDIPNIYTIGTEIASKGVVLFADYLPTPSMSKITLIIWLGYALDDQM